MADKSRDAGREDKKNARRDAKIEEKRRKLAEKRKERSAAAGGTSANTGSNAARPVTADSNNRKMRLKLPESELKKAGGDAEKKPSRKEPLISSKTIAQDLKLKEVASAAKKTGRRGAQGMKKIMDRNFLTPVSVVKGLIVLIIIIGIIYGIVQVRDYYNKKTDVIVTDEGYEHAIRHENCVALNGIDVSQHQKGDINWDKVKSSGIDFVFIRVGYRAADDGSLHEDETFKDNIVEAEKAGLMVGVYFYSQALTPEEGKEEAEYVLDKIKGYNITMPVVIDYEIYKDGRLDKKIKAGELYAASLYHDIVLGFTSTVENKGYESAVYASKDMLTNYMQEDLIDDMANIWLARYEKTPDLNADFWFWQCSDEGKAGGIDGSVDKDFWYLEPGKAYPTRAKHKKSAASVEEAKIHFDKDSYKLHNFRAEPKYSLTWNGQRMAEGHDYVSSVVHNTQSGTGYVVIRGTGRYKDWVMFPFTIE